jgi:hypothetical protein
MSMPGEEQIRDYLLGNLQGAQREDMESRYFADEQLLEQMDAIEDEMISEYARGRLTSPQREMFEREYLSQPRRRRRVEFALALDRVLRQSENVKIATGSFWSRWMASLRVVEPFATPVAAVAAVLLVVVAAQWNAERKAALTAVQSAQIEKDKRLTTEREIDSLKRATPAFLLISGLSRGGDTSGNNLVVPPDLPRIKLEFEMEQKLSYYLVEVRDADARLVSRQRLLEPRMELATDVVPDGDYRVRIQGPGSDEAVATFQFNLSRRSRPAGRR